MLLFILKLLMVLRKLCGLSWVIGEIVGLKYRLRLVKRRLVIGLVINFFFLNFCLNLKGLEVL